MVSFIERMAVAVRADGWENVILGLGGSRDPSTYTTFGGRGPLPDSCLEALYVEDHFAAKIIESAVAHAMRPGWAMTSGGKPDESADLRDAYAQAERALGVAFEMFQGATWARAFGGAVTWIGIDDGRPQNMPVDESAIASVRFLHTFDRRDVTIHRVNADPLSPDYQKPEIFRIIPQVVAGEVSGGVPPMPPSVAPTMLPQHPGGAFVHASRVVMWPGQPTTDTRRRELQGWDDSILERCWDALRQVGEDYGAKSILLGRISQGIYKIKDLYAMIAGNRETILQRRMSLIDKSRSRARSILLDTEEDFVNVTQPLSGVGEMLEAALLRLAAAACMPVAVLMGQPLSSMEGTNDGDLEVWTQALEEWRAKVLGPAHARIARAILLAKDGPTKGKLPEGWAIDYGELRTAPPKEGAEIRKLEAETDAIRIDKGIATAEAIAFARFSPQAGGDLVLDEEELKANLERRKELAAQPPKDNAELGTVGARSGAALQIVERVAQGAISRQSGKTALVELFRFTEDVAEQYLGPADFTPRSVATSPGPDPDPEEGQGAGAPEGLPGFNDGGARDEMGEPRKAE